MIKLSSVKMPVLAIEGTDFVIIGISVLLAILVGVAVGYFLRIKFAEKRLNLSKETAEKIVEEGKKEAEKIKRENILDAKQEIHQIRKTADDQIKLRRDVVEDLESKITNREQSLDRRSENLDKREESFVKREERLNSRRDELEQLNSKVEEIFKMQENKLTEIASLTKEEAKEVIMTQVRDDISLEIAAYIKEEEENAKLSVNTKAKDLLSQAMQKFASETTSERTVSVVDLPNDEMKGRIIGREGRNIKTFETLTGVDLIIDDTPEAVVLSGFDPIRREVAKRSLATLVSDGRIHPAQIEEVVSRVQKEVEDFIRESGELAVFEVAVGKVHPDIIKLLGKLHFRTSYGQNVLKHSIEVAFLAGKLAAEIGEDEILARRAGLFHDIGKAVDHEVDGSHVEIGVDIMKRYREPLTVIDAIASHHGDTDPKTIIAVLVAAADALSAARPGARSESVENYIRRLEQLEEISTSVPGVNNAYAIQAGREIRVIVKPDEIDDLSTFKVAREIKEKIESNMSYPGTIKVTVIRETRASDIAK